MKAEYICTVVPSSWFSSSSSWWCCHSWSEIDELNLPTCCRCCCYCWVMVAALVGGGFPFRTYQYCTTSCAQSNESFVVVVYCSFSTSNGIPWEMLVSRLALECGSGSGGKEVMRYSTNTRQASSEADVRAIPIWPLWDAKSLNRCNFEFALHARNIITTTNSNKNQSFQHKFEIVPIETQSGKHAKHTKE